LSQIRKRIEKLERQIPEKMTVKQGLNICFHGAHPTEEEKEIGYRVLEEIKIEKGKQFAVFFLPYDCENTIVLFRDHIIYKDSNLGILFTENFIIKPGFPISNWVHRHLSMVK